MLSSVLSHSTIFFSILNKLLFSIFWEILQRSRPACYFFFSSLERFWFILQAFFAVFLYFLDNVWMKIFRNFYTYMKKKSAKKKKIMKKFIKRIKKVYFKFSFVMIYIIHKILVLLKNQLNFLKDNIFECFLRRIMDFFFWKK